MQLSGAVHSQTQAVMIDVTFSFRDKNYLLYYVILAKTVGTYKYGLYFYEDDIFESILMECSLVFLPELENQQFP